ncbi:MAG: hypothetical protein AAGG01_24655, partial [Planctomycetota bacterium]
EGMTLLRRQVRADGAMAREVVMDDSVCDCCAPSLVSVADGSMVAVYRHRSQQNIRDVYLTRRDPRDGVWSEPAAVHEDGWRLEGCPVSGPAAAAAGSTVAVAWLTRATDDGEAEIRVAFSRDGGVTCGAPIVLEHGATLGRIALAPVLARPGDDRFVLAHLAVDPGEEAAAASPAASWRAAVVSADRGASEFTLLGEVPSTRASGRLDLLYLVPGVLSAVWTGPAGLVKAEVRCADGRRDLDRSQ